MSEDELHSAGPRAARAGARPALSGDRRRGRVHLERCAHLAPHHDRTQNAEQPRTTPLIFGRDGDDYLVVASMGGAPTHPNWYRNLLANPSGDRSRSAPIASTSRRAPPGTTRSRDSGRS